ncbi:MAG: M28 family peptidase [Bacillota bacterium]
MRTTLQSADNDASGNGIMLHLAEVFRDVDTEYSLLFIATDGEEYGMLGAKHFAENHPLNRRVSMAISLDNVGRYNGVTSPGGWLYYHTPEDTIDRISPYPMEQVGVLVEALIREMDRSGDTSQSPEPFLYFEASRTFLPSLPLKAVVLALVVPLCWWMFLAWNGRWMGLRHLLGQCLNLLVNALPFLGGLLSLYLSAAVNLIPRFSYYPAPPKDPVLYEVKWVALAIMLGMMVLSAALLPRLKKGIPLELKTRRPVALAVLSALSMAVYLWNPFALLFLLPALYLWPLMDPRRSLPGRVANLGLFLCGDLVLFLGLLMYSYELYLGWYMSWYFLQMLAFGMIPLHAALAGITAIASGITILAWTGTARRWVTPAKGWILRDDQPRSQSSTACLVEYPEGVASIGLVMSLHLRPIPCSPGTEAVTPTW